MVEGHGPTGRLHLFQLHLGEADPGTERTQVSEEGTAQHIFETQASSAEDPEWNNRILSDIFKGGKNEIFILLK